MGVMMSKRSNALATIRAEVDLQGTLGVDDCQYLLARVETLEQALGGLLKELEFVEQQALGELAILAADVARPALKGGQ